MGKDKRYENFGYSFLIIALMAIFVLSFVFGRDELNAGLSAWFLFVIVHYIGIGMGMILIALRLLKVLKKKSSFVYIFIMLLNIVIGLSNLGFVFFSNIAQSPLWFHLSFNLLLGGISFIDIFLVDQLFNQTDSRA